jgi:cytochrome c oxidase subunit 3
MVGVGHNRLTDRTTHDHPPHLAHHFATPQQQFEAGKLGMWLFLATEILLFGGLFCAYAVYRANHPEIFIYAHQYLDVRLGGTNTLVLICSSLTMAWAVRCAQLGQRRGLILNLALTLACACGFLGIKYVEYHHKWKHGLLWGARFHPDEAPGGSDHAPPSSSPASTKPTARASTARGHVATGMPDATTTSAPATTRPADERSTIAPAATGPAGLAPYVLAGQLEEPTPHGILTRPSNVHIFFGIYFAMTGLHGLHVLAGMSVIVWLLVGASRGRFGGHYFTPVDFGGLYWHLVDLIWIYLFPLLYLIH